LVHGAGGFLQIRSPGAAPDWYQWLDLLVHVALGTWLLVRLRR